MSGYWNSPDLLFTSGGKVFRGFTTLSERYRSTYGTGERMGRLTFSDLEVHPLGSSAAWALGRWSLALGSERPGGVFTLVFRKLDGEWKIVHDHTSTGADRGATGARSPSEPAPGAVAPAPPGGAP